MLTRSPALRALALAALLVPPLAADGPHAPETCALEIDRPDAHAPLGVMGDHVHGRGGAMFSYRHMTMEMEGNRNGDQRLSPQQVLQSFMVAPLRMTMTMDMFGVMVPTSDDLTLMLMIPEVSLGMDHVTRTGARFRTEVEGVGDIRLSALGVLHRGHRRQLHYTAGLSFPTGSIQARAPTPMGPNTLLPYPMQLGAGTTGFHPALTYQVQGDRGSFGLQLAASTYLGYNDEGWKPGALVQLQGWAARRLSHRFSLSGRLSYQDQSGVEGFDARLAPVVPTALPSTRGGQRLDLGLGVNWKLGGHRLAFEWVVPLEQDLAGPQLEFDRSLQVAYQFAF